MRIHPEPLTTPSAAESSLSDLDVGVVGVVTRLQMPDAAAERGRVARLLELGFLPGETVRVLARGPAGGEPLAVRVGDATFALRSHEAQHVRVARLGDIHR
ncbi:ferrous iron transport protein A [Tibeticola sediminis]|jgi:ferrous iron transport protein A|uniref:Ferrous iron transport protein A n=1 Tax=Tibeticola sediminis TaxID=1917811 RepID=A0A3N4UDE4_9BURK|nr:MULTISPECIES: FeoA family protein [Tibeticola]MCI4441561.1 ferrous iron transport protein A [Tibeticola sp.]RPE65109.1 ferrous iron transport protein A [Tibeticola sediminis]